MKKIILASTSPRRKKILKEAGLHFEAIGSGYKEDMTLKMKPKDLARFLSYKKAEYVSRRYKKHIIVGADTFITYGKEILGKPHTVANAKKMLKKLSNKKIRVITGLTVIDSSKNKHVSIASETIIHIRRLTVSEINNYIKTEEPLDKAGAFGIQGIGANVIRKIEGDYLSIVGLPIFELLKILRKIGVRVI